MAQSLVTYLGGAVKGSQWLAAAANPSAAIHYFDDCLSLASLTNATAQNAATYVGGHATTVNGASDATTTSSTAILCSAPSRCAFACKGRHGADAANGIVGLAAVAAGAAVTPGTTAGAYFTTTGGNLTFRVKGSGAEKTLAVGAAPTVDAEHGFEFEAGRFRVFVNGEFKGEVVEPFPAGEMRFVAGKTNGAANSARFVSFDYVMVSADR